MPFFRASSDKKYTDREPWLQTPRVFRAIRNAIDNRYDLIHYLYLTFYEHTITGEPLMRTMFNEFPWDAEVYDMST
jgi:alpha-glucosidase (family GH31 glycosyl hydrolase)